MMSKHPLTLALAVAVATALTGCDGTALTEQDYIQRAKDFEDKGDPKTSIIELKNAIQKNPDSPQARLLLGQIYLKLGMGTEAEKELTRAKKLGVKQETVNPDLGEALLLTRQYKRVLDEILPDKQFSNATLAKILQLRGSALLGLGQLQNACEAFRQSLDTNASNPATYWGLAQCAAAEQDTLKARAFLDTALKIKDNQARTWIFIGELEQLNHDFDAALNAYTNSIKLEPGNLEALRSRASINISLGRLEAARPDIESVRRIAPKSLAANYLDALFSFREGKHAQARDTLQDALKLAPDYLPALMLAGAIEYSAGNLQTAESHLNKAARAAPRNAYIVRMLAATQLRLGRVDDAAKTLAPVDLDEVKDAGILAVAGEIATARKEFSRAALLFARAAELSPDNAALRIELGLSRLAQGDSRAMADLQIASSMDQSNVRADNIIILRQLKERQFDAALDSVVALEKKQPQSPLPWNYRGSAYFGKGNLAQARDSFERALALDPSFFPAAANLARLDIMDKRPDAARKRFESILSKDAKNVSAMLALAELAASQKRDDDSLNWLNKAANTDPKFIEPRVRLVQHYLSKQDYQKARELAQQVSKTNPDNLKAMALLGSVQVATNDHQAAIATFNRMITVAPQAPDAYLRLALAQIATKQFASARNALKKALLLKPDFLKAQDTLLGLEVAENKPEAALVIARQIQAQYSALPLGFEREGDIELSRQHHLAAAKAYEKALGKGAGSSSAVGFHRALVLARETQTAEQHLSAWLSKNPNDVIVRNYAAEYFLANNRGRDAISQYEAITRLAPPNAVVLNNLANLYHREKDSRALATAEQAFRLAPDNPGVQDTLGWILLETDKKLAPATAMLAKAAANAPKIASIRFHYGVALSKSGNRTEAKRQLNAALAIDPRFPEAETARALLKNL